MSLGVHTMQPSTSDQLSKLVHVRGPPRAVDAAHRCLGATTINVGDPSQADPRQLADSRQVHAGDESGADDADAERHSPNTSRAVALTALRSAPASA